MPKAQKWDCEWSRLSHGTSVGFVFIEIDAQWILGGEGRPHGSLGTDGGSYMSEDTRDENTVGRNSNCFCYRDKMGRNIVKR